MQDFSRRNVAKTALWLSPTVVAATATAAFAASDTPPSITSNTRFGGGNMLGSTIPDYRCSGSYQYQIRQTSSTGSYLTIYAGSDGGTLSDLVTTFWLATDSGTTWTSVSGSSSCWSTPVAVPTENITYNGVLYRAYRSTFSCPLTLGSNNTFQLPSTQFFNWLSTCQSSSTARSKIYHYTQTVALTNSNGTTTLIKDNGWSNTMS